MTSNVVIEELSSSVDALIRENRVLKQQVAKLERVVSGGRGQPASRELVALQRRLSRTLDGRPAWSSAAGQQRRPISDPAVLQSRRTALAKAREALAAKRAAQRTSQS